MAYDGTLKFDTSVDTKGFQSGISKLGSVAKTGLSAVGTALAAVGAAMGAAATSGIQYNAQMEQYVTSFQTMLGSAEQAQSMVNDLKSLGAETPLEMEGLAKNAQTLLAFGTAGEQVIPTLRMLGDVALGDQQRMEQLTLAFAQVSSTGKLTGQDLLQMVNAGFNPLNEISKITGKSVEELKEEMADGAISAEMVAAAFEHATSEGGQFYGAMKAQSKTLSGQLSTLKDNVKSLLGEITQGLTNSIQNEALPAINEYVSQIQDAFTENGLAGVAEAFGDVMADAIKRITRTLPQFVKTGTQVIKAFLSGIKENAGEIAQGVVDIVGELVSGIANMLPELVDAGMSIATGLVNGVAEALPRLLPDVISGAIDAVTSIIANIPALLEAGEQLIFGLLEGILRAIPEILTSLSIALGTLFEDVAKKIGLNIDGALTDNLKKTREMLDAHKDLMEQISSSAEAYQESTSEIKANTAVLKEQKDELYKLVAQENKTEGQKKRILSLVDQLNEAIPDLNLVYDEQTDTLNRTAESVDQYIAAKMQEANIAALEERLIELTKERNALDEESAEIARKAAEAYALLTGQTDQLFTNRWEQLEIINAHNEREAETMKNALSLVGVQVQLAAAYESSVSATQAAADATGEVAEATDAAATSMEIFEEKLEPVIIAGQDVSAQLAALGGDMETLEERAKETQARFEELSTATTDAFSKMSEGTKISIDEMVENLAYNADRTEEYAQLIDTIMQRLGDDVPEGFKEWLQELGPEQANALRELANAAPDQFEALVDEYERGVRAAGEAAVTEQGVQGKALADETQDTVNAVAGVIENTDAPQSAARSLVYDIARDAGDAVENADFDSVGRNIAAGLIAGMNSMASEVATAARTLAREALDAMESELDISSPSRVFEWIGSMIPAGLVEGIKGGERDVGLEMANLSRTAAQFDLPAYTSSVVTDNSQTFGDINLYITTDGDSATIGDDIFAAFSRELRFRGVTL